MNTRVLLRIVVAVAVVAPIPFFAQAAAEDARANCIISRALASVPITLKATLAAG